MGGKRRIGACGLVLALGALLLSSCGGGGGSTTTVTSTATATTPTTASNPYPASLETRYMSNCQATAARTSGRPGSDFTSACRCALTYIEAHENLQQFIADTARFARTIAYPPIWRQAVLACRGQIPPA